MEEDEYDLGIIKQSKSKGTTVVSVADVEQSEKHQKSKYMNKKISKKLEGG